VIRINATDANADEMYNAMRMFHFVLAKTALVRGMLKINKVSMDHIMAMSLRGFFFHLRGLEKPSS
jgi:hypothetical protein